MTTTGDSSSDSILEYDEVLNKYHQKTKTAATKKRLNDLIIVCNSKLKQKDIEGFNGNLDDCLCVFSELNSVKSLVGVS